MVVLVLGSGSVSAPFVYPTQAGATNSLAKVRNKPYVIGNERLDTDLDVDGSDLWYYSAYDERWRMVATYRGSDDDPKERFVHQQAGADGEGGSSYIDLVAFREKDVNTDWDEESDGVLEQRIYYCQNQHADVVSLITSAGGMREMDRYSAYGVPFGLPVGDANSDGKSNSADRTQIQNWINASNHYDMRGDLDLDGDVDLDDKDTLQYTYGVVDLGRGILSANAVGNRKGVAGYEIEPRLGRSKYQVRNRTIDVELGNWLRRDSVGYVEGLNAYCYSRSAPTMRQDPFGTTSGGIGLIPGCPDDEPRNRPGDGWCHDQYNSHCRGDECYRSYGTGTQGGQQCCYRNGTLITPASTGDDACVGTIDLWGGAVGESGRWEWPVPVGQCHWSPYRVYMHSQTDVADAEHCGEEAYEAMQECMRAAGIASGTGGGCFGNSDAELQARYKECKAQHCPD